MIVELNKWDNFIKVYEFVISFRGDVQIVFSDISFNMW